MYYSET